VTRALAGPCWVVRDADGSPWDDERDGHYDTAEAVSRVIAEIREIETEDDAVLTAPGGICAEGVRRKTVMLAGLHAVQLDQHCTVVTCDGPCWTDGGPDGDPKELGDTDEDYTFHLAAGEMAAGEMDVIVTGMSWTTDGVHDLCGECKTLVATAPVASANDVPLPGLEAAR
jgi:hypothetical protein